MERWHAQNNLSHLLNTEALLGKLDGSRPRSMPVPTAARPCDEPTALDLASESAMIPLDLKLWPRDVVSPHLRERLGPSIESNALRSSSSASLNLAEHIDLDRLRQPITPVDSLSRVLDIFIQDVLAARDRLLMLNPGRRKMIEHRLEFIARKVARMRGERLGRPLALLEVLKESYREVVFGPDANLAPKLSMAAWRGFVLEVAFYNLLELFFLKSLDVYGWRVFEIGDLGRMNFAAHTFLSQRAANFAHDKHCWNFVRTNLYSWYVPSQKAISALESALADSALSNFSWSDRDLETWASSLPAHLKSPHLEFAEESSTARLVIDLLEKELSTPVTTAFHGRVICKKFFLPALELGGVGLAILDRALTQIRQAAPDAFDGGIADESSQLHRALWSCESESFEVCWAEVSALLKILRTARSNNDFVATESNNGGSSPVCLYRVPHAMHVVNSLALELHNMDQLQLGGPVISKLQQGSAAQIQQLEAFDGSVVTDHPDRAKSAAWMKALASQLPYWRTLVSNSTNLNWGELHLHLALTKLKDNGLCIYLSHRTLPEGGDGEKLRKALLSHSVLECFIELHEEAARPYRYLYVFRRVSKKLERDQHRPRFGKMKSPNAPLSLNALEEASSVQSEIAERGWDHLFVRGAAPLVRHLNHKFPKLFQIASIGDGAHLATLDSGMGRRSVLFSGPEVKALEIYADASGQMRFRPLATQPTREMTLVFPHNPVDLPWIASVLNSAPAQFWIRHQLLATVGNGTNRAPRLQELRSCPIVDLSHSPSDLVHEALEWLGRSKPDTTELRSWSCRAELPVIERYARYVALSKRYASLERIVARYRPLFTSESFEELRVDAIGKFYPPALLCHLSQSPDIRIQYAERARSSLLPENWGIGPVHSVVKETNGKPAAFVIVQTRQGPVIQMMLPLAVRDYMVSQLKSLLDHTWGEALSLLLLPRDIALFAAQTGEITRVVCDTAREMQSYQKVLDEMALDLFEIPTDMRQFVPLG